MFLLNREHAKLSQIHPIESLSKSQFFVKTVNRTGRKIIDLHNASDIN